MAQGAYKDAVLTEAGVHCITSLLLVVMTEEKKLLLYEVNDLIFALLLKERIRIGGNLRRIVECLTGISKITLVENCCHVREKQTQRFLIQS